MSSRNSALCPQCRERRLVERERHGDKLAEAYGKASQSEYERIKSERPPKIEAETMGEYYEWEFTSDGKFWFHFHFSCDVCGFYWTHNGETQYPHAGEKGVVVSSGQTRTPERPTVRKDG